MQTIICYIGRTGGVRGVFRDAANLTGAPAPEIAAGVPYLVKFRVFDGIGEAAPLPADVLTECSGWSFELDGDYDGATTCKIVADNANIATAQANEYTEFSVPLPNTYTEELAAALGSAARVTLHGELVGYDANGAAKFALQANGVTIRNRVSGLAEPTPIPPHGYEDAVRDIVSGAVAAASSTLQSQINQRPTSSGAQQIADSKANTAVNAHNVSGASHDGLFARVIQTRVEMPDPEEYANGPLICYIGETGEIIPWVKGHIYQAQMAPNPDDPEGAWIPTWVDLTPGLPEGVILSNAEIDTVIGNTRITATSNGGVTVQVGGSGGTIARISSGSVLVSGSGASVVLSGGEIAAGVEGGGEGFEKGVMLTVTSLGAVVSSYDNVQGNFLSATLAASGVFVDGSKVATEPWADSRFAMKQLVTSTYAGISGTIGVLSGGTSFVFTSALYSLEVDSVVKTTEASYIHFTLDSVTAPTPVVISGASGLNSATFEGGKEYLVGVFDGMCVANEVTQ